MADVVGMPNLRVIASPGRGGGFTFDTKRFVAVMPALHEAFDFLIVDAPPLALNPEVMPLCLHFHSVILVAEAERTRIHELQEVTRELGTAKAKLLGVVLNRQKDNLPATFKKWV